MNTYIKFDASKEEADVIHKIAVRAVADYAKHGVRLDLLNTEMGIMAVHCNGNPLRLEDFLNADDFNFAHDITGINNYINRKTGKLTRHFEPRFTDYEKLNEQEKELEE